MESKTKSFVLVVMLGLAGCASTPQAPVTLTLGGDKEFTYGVDANGNNVSQEAFGQALVENIRRSTGYSQKSTRPTADPSMYFVKGVEVTPKASGVEIAYVNGEYFSNTQRTKLTRTTTVFTFTAVENVGSVTFKVAAPKHLDTETELGLLFLPISTLDSEVALANDVEKIFKALNPSISLVKQVSGEIDSKYSVDSITANFRRKCRGGFAAKDYLVSKTNISSANTCLLETGGVTVSIQPYKDGSKVVYSFSVPYSLGDKAQSTYSAERQIRMIQGIESIVKD